MFTYSRSVLNQFRVETIKNGNITMKVKGKPVTLTGEWLADNERETFNHTTQQRESNAYGVKKNFEKPEAKSALATDNALRVQWNHTNNENRYEKLWIEEMTDKYNTDNAPLFPKVLTHAEPPSFPPSKELWDSTTLPSHPTAVYTEVMSSDERCLAWLDKIDKYGFCLLQGCPDTFETFNVEILAKRAANYVRNSVFGGVWDFESGYAHADTAYTDKALPAHVDSCYCYDPPGLQMLHCVELEATGGLSTLVDGFRALQLLQEDDAESFKILQSTGFSFSYIDNQQGIHLKNTTPTIVTDLSNIVKQIRYNDCDRDPFPFSAPLSVYEAWNKLSYYIKRPEATVTFRLEPGTTLIFDNWRLLHGRTEFKGKRKVVGCYMNMEDFQSRLAACRKSKKD